MPLSDSSQWNVAAPDVYGCRLWKGRVDKDGYPVAWTGKGRPLRVHRALWQERRGPILDDMEIEHRCRRRSCLTLVHLCLVTRSDNERRKNWRSRVRRDLCDEGHGKENAVVTPAGGIVCRTCSRRSNEP